MTMWFQTPQYLRWSRLQLLRPENRASMLEKLGDSLEHQAMRRSVNAILDLTTRYEQTARAQGLTVLADTLARVPAHGARTFREALQSLRILHYTFWCEGEYHNTLGRFDQYMYPYLEKDLGAENIRALFV